MNKTTILDVHTIMHKTLHAADGKKVQVDTTNHLGPIIKRYGKLTSQHVYPMKSLHTIKHFALCKTSECLSGDQSNTAHSGGLGRGAETQ